MSDHRRMREMASAAYDGELGAEQTAALQQHVATCDECRVFANALPRLGEAARAIPEEAAPPLDVWRFAQPAAARTARPRIGAVLAAAAVAAALIVGAVPVRTFRVTPAAAAAPLLQIRTLDATREIVQTDIKGNVTRTTERIRYRAPASTRIDRTIVERGRTTTETEILTPGRRTLIRGTAAMLETGRPPDADPVPEPLSPALALAGRDEGPGPMVAGRPTRRIVLNDEEAGVRREALIDATRSTLLSSEVAVVLRKDRFEARQSTVKRVTRIDYNVALSPSLFTARAVTVQDAGFRSAAASGFSVAPAAAPDGFDVVASGTGRDGDAVLYAKGAFTILVRIGAPRQSTPDDVRELSTTVAGRPAIYTVALYGMPTLHFRVSGRSVSIGAPMPVQDLATIAGKMFPSE